MPDRSDVVDSSGHARASAAFFDVDGTLVSTHIVHQYIHVRRFLANRCGGALTRLSFPLWLAAFYLRCVQYLILDRRSRTQMNIAFYRNYAHLPVEPVRRAALDCFQHVLRPNLFPPAVDCVRHHLRSGRRVVLVTGSIDFLIAPLAKSLCVQGEDGCVEMIARTLVTRGDRFTGALDGPPLGEEEKATAVRKFAGRESIDLVASYAYGDSIADLPMLESVGHPVAANPDRALAAIADERGWPVEQWRDDARSR